MDLTLAEVQERTGMRPAEVCREVKSGHIQVTMQGMEVSVLEDSLTEYQQSRSDDALGIKALREGLSLEQREDVDPIAMAEDLLKACRSGWQRISLDPVFGAFQMRAVHREGKVQVLSLSKSCGRRLRDSLRALSGGDAGSFAHKPLRREDETGVVQVLLRVHPTRMGDHIEMHWPLLDSPLELLDGLEDLPSILMAIDGPGLFIISGPLESTADQLRRALAIKLSGLGRMVVSIELRAGVEEESLVQLNSLEGESPSRLIRRALSMGPDVVLIDEIPDQDTLKALLEATGSGLSVVAQGGGADLASTLARLTAMEIPRSFLASQMSGLMGSIAMRKLCESCAQEVDAHGIDELKDVAIFENKGCPSCASSCDRLMHSVEFAHQTELSKALRMEHGDDDTFRKLDLGGRRQRLLLDLEQRRIPLPEFQRLTTS